MPDKPTSAGDTAFRATGDQCGAAGGLVAIEGDRGAVDVVGGAAFDDGEHALAQRATDHVPDTGDGLAVDVGVAEGAEHLATVGGGIAEADDVFHGGNSVSDKMASMPVAKPNMAWQIRGYRPAVRLMC